MDVRDVVAPRDLDELMDIEDRVTTEGLLSGRRPWPYAVLPLKRWDGPEDVEVGYVRRRDGAGPADPIVYTDDGPVRFRHYADLGQLLEAGWRAD